MFSGIPNLLTQIFSCFLLKQGRIFVLRSKMLLKLLIFTHKKKTLCKIFSRKQKNSFGKKLWICRLRIHENVPQASYKCGLLPRLYYETLAIFLQLPREPLRNSGGLKPTLPTRHHWDVWVIGSTYSTT